MAERRKGAPGSFGAPLEDLLPKLGKAERGEHIKIDIHRRQAGRDDEAVAGQCRIFMLNQRLYETAKK